MDKCIRCAREYAKKPVDYSFCQTCEDWILSQKRLEINLAEARKKREAEAREEKERQEKLSQAKKDKDTIELLMNMPFEERQRSMRQLNIKVKYPKPNDDIADFKHVYKALKGLDGK